MKKLSRSLSRFPKNPVPASRQRGIALVTALLLLTLLSAVTVGMVLSASSDELTSSYYRNMRGSFYAADSGLTIARTAMLNSLQSLVPVSITNRAIPPIGTASTTASTIVSNINSTYGGSMVSLNAGQAANSWPAKYQLQTGSTGLTQVDCRPAGGAGVGSGCDSTGASAVCTGGGTACAAAITSYSYTYTYNLKTVGQTRSSETTTLTDRGNLIVNITFGGGIPVPTSFAAWGFFVNNFDLCGSLTLVPGTVTGPAHSNGSWTFGTSGSYIFTDPVTASNANLGYRVSAGCYSSPNDPFVKTGSGGGTIDPSFQAGYSLGQTPIALPSNDYSQKQAVLDGIGTQPMCGVVPVPCAPSQAAMGAVLKKSNGSSYPATGSIPSSGVYLPYQTTGCPGASPCMVGGGMYLQGNSAVTLSAGTTGSPLNQPTQVYTIVQGSTTTTVTVNLTANSNVGTTTIVQSGAGGSSITLNGVPTQYSDCGPPPCPALRDATMVYVNGSISSLKGGTGGVAIQDEHAVTVVASSNIVITDDIKYKHAPVTTSQNQIPGTPPATLIPNSTVPLSDTGQVLGIYTNGGNIQLNNAGNSTLDIQAALASLSSATGATNTIENIGSTITTLNIMGGRIQNSMGNIGATTRNIYFDRRFSQGGFAPPWFPATEVTPVGASSTTVTPSTSRVQWLNQTPF